MDLESTVEGFFRDEVDRAFRDEGLDPGDAGRALPGPAAGRATPPSRSRSAPLALRCWRPRRRAAAASGGASCARSATRRSTCRASGPRAWQTSSVDVDYYIELGGSAYGELARGGTGWTGDPFGDVFGELARQLRALRRGAGARQPADGASPASNQDVVRLYRRWQRTQEPARGRAAGGAGRGPGRGRRAAAVTRGAARSRGARALDPVAPAARPRGALPGRDAPRRRRLRDRRASSARGGRRGARAARAAAGPAGRRRARAGAVRRRRRAREPRAQRSRRRASTTRTSPTSAWRSRG